MTGLAQDVAGWPDDIRRGRFHHAHLPTDGKGRAVKNNNKGAALSASFVRIASIDVHAIRQMYQVFAQYYENTTWDIFLSDLSNKTGAFILRNAAGRVVGFSTLRTCDIDIGGRRVHGVFSGDTIIERAYWGSRALQREFFKFMIAEKFRYPREPIYWFLISKGFKTYLLLANNLFSFYPRHDREEPHLADIVDAYCQQLFPAHYDRTRRILDFGQDYQPLRSDVAEISERMREENPAIRFFEERNPEWRRGTELPCVGEIGWSDLAKFTLRFARKPVSKGRMDAELAPGLAPVVVKLRSVRG